MFLFILIKKENLVQCFEIVLKLIPFKLPYFDTWNLSIQLPNSSWRVIHCVGTKRYAIIRVLKKQRNVKWLIRLSYYHRNGRVIGAPNSGWPSLTKYLLSLKFAWSLFLCLNKMFNYESYPLLSQTHVKKLGEFDALVADSFKTLICLCLIFYKSSSKCFHKVNFSVTYFFENSNFCITTLFNVIVTPFKTIYCTKEHETHRQTLIMIQLQRV